MKIAFDLDGVLYDFESCFRSWMQSVDWTNRQRYEPRATTWGFFSDDWGMTLDEFKNEMRLAAAGDYLYRSQGIEQSWLDLVNNLVEQGHTLHAVTHRAEVGSMAATERWIAAYDLPFTSVTFAHDKTIVDADVLIEDRGENIDVWLEKTDKPAIIVEQAWNADWRDRLEEIDPTPTSPGGGWRVWVARDAANVGQIIGLLSDGTDSRATEIAHNTQESPQETILQEAQRLIHGDRQQSYGHPATDFTRTGRMWGAILGIDDVDPALVGLCMAAVKISREVNAPKRDNLTDLAGYAGTVAMVRERQGLA